MFGLRRPDPTTIYVVADHLDAVLAVGEDMLKQRLDVVAWANREPSGSAGPDLRTFVETVRTLEMILVAHALQARTRARELAGADASLKRLLALFAGGTAALEDAVEELGDATVSDFDTGDDPLAYLRSRGLLAGDAGSLLGIETMRVGEHFLIVRRIGLGVLMDLAAACLDALEDCYDLAGDDDIRDQIAAARFAAETHSPGP
jgi:hypothetical protein